MFPGFVTAANYNAAAAAAPVNNVNNFNHPYSVDDRQLLTSIEDEATGLFPVGKEYSDPASLRDTLRNWAAKKGFSITSHGSAFNCSRCAVPQSYLNKRLKLAPVPESKQRNRQTTRVDCPFSVKFSKKNRQDANDKTIKITRVCFRHDNGCLPSPEQLAVEKRKAGSLNVSVHEARIKSIMATLNTNVSVSTSLLREMMKPLYPPGTSLDAKLIFNFRLKIKRMIAAAPGDVMAVTVTEDDETDLLAPYDENAETPSFLTEALQQYQELLAQALHDQNDVTRIKKFLQSMSAADSTFTYRESWSDDGTPTGFVWQTGVMRRDFELFGDVLFVDCLGRHLNNKGWPVNTLAMLDGEKRVCLPCEGLTIGESVEGYAWLIKSTVDMAPKRQLSDIKVIYADGILAGETILRQLGIEDTCHLVLDHHHLLSEEIGAWPKEFTLAWWGRVKDDLGIMVKSYDVVEYNAALGRLRAVVARDRRLSQYLETSIHAKRHLFANHLIQNYHTNLKRQGNVPAEANHSSIVGRIGSLVVTPVELISNLINRHVNISAERNHEIQQYSLQCNAL